MPSLDPNIIVIDNPEWLLQQLGLKPARTPADSPKILLYLCAYLGLGLTCVGARG
nr:hypothetical protein [Candidatus Sigynarchaeum springense]